MAASPSYSDAEPILILISSAVVSPIKRLCFLRIYVTIASSSASPPTLMLLQLAIPPSDITATSHVPPPMSTIIEPVAS